MREYQIGKVTMRSTNVWVTLQSDYEYRGVLHLPSVTDLTEKQFFMELTSTGSKLVFFTAEEIKRIRNAKSMDTVEAKRVIQELVEGIAK